MSIPKRYCQLAREISERLPREREAAPAPWFSCMALPDQERALPADVLNAGANSDVVREGPFGSAWFTHRTKLVQ